MRQFYSKKIESVLFHIDEIDFHTLCWGGKRDDSTFPANDAQLFMVFFITWRFSLRLVTFVERFHSCTSCKGVMCIGELEATDSSRQCH